jgi:hypothetical protein
MLLAGIQVFLDPLPRPQPAGAGSAETSFIGMTAFPQAASLEIGTGDALHHTETTTEQYGIMKSSPEPD